MSLFLGFDGGGTKTDCVLLDTDGAIAGEGRGGPANPLRTDFNSAFSSLRDAASEALAAATVSPEEIAGVCAGLAGAGRVHVVRPCEAFLTQEFPRAAVHVVPDYEIALEAAVGGGPGPRRMDAMPPAKPLTRAGTGPGLETRGALLRSGGARLQLSRGRGIWMRR